MSGASHFKGKDNVMNAYELNEVGPWAIFSGRDILFQCTDPSTEVCGALLDKVLDQLIEGGAGGQFQLKIYEELQPGKKINNNTPHNYSFKFQLLTDDEYERSTGRTLGGPSAIGAVLDRLTAIETKLQEREEESDPGPENKWQAAIGAVIQRPEVQTFLMGKVFSIVNGITNYFTPKTRTSMAGMQTDDPMTDTQKTAAELFQSLPPEEKMKFDQAVSVLLAGDPQIGTNLMKLANILQTDPQKYQLLTKMA